MVRFQIYYSVGQFYLCIAGMDIIYARERAAYVPIVPVPLNLSQTDVQHQEVHLVECGIVHDGQRGFYNNEISGVWVRDVFSRELFSFRRRYE